MWELAHRRGYFDKIEVTKIDDDQYAIVQNFIAHRDEPFGLPMPTGKELFPLNDDDEQIGGNLKQNVVTLESWGANVR